MPKTAEEVAAYKAAHYQANKARARELNRAWRAANPASVKAHGAKWRSANPDKVRAKHLRDTYGLTLAEFDAMVADQDARCGVCRSALQPGRATHVDHDHATGAVRGLLCTRCNTGLARLGDDVFGVARALAYLQAAA